MVGVPLEEEVNENDGTGNDGSEIHCSPILQLTNFTLITYKQQLAVMERKVKVLEGSTAQLYLCHKVDSD